MIESFDPPPCLLLGPGPSNAEPRVLQAQARALLGQFDPRFTAVMNEVMALARAVFQTRNERTFPVSGTSRAGIEAVMASVIEEGDRVVVGSCGRFGWLLEDIARRYRAEVRVVEAPWGEPIDPDAVRRALGEAPTKCVALVHGETSTGVLQPLEVIAAACREHDALLLVDAVVTLGGCEVAVDAMGWDAAMAGTQKCLGGPSGMAPITYNARVEAVIAARRTPVASNYLDLVQLQRYWSPERWNHHTVPTSLVYGLHEMLRLVLAEGLAARWERHRRVGRAMAAGLAALGLRRFGNAAYALPFLTPVWVPEGVDDAAVRAALLYDHGIEIGTAFGPLAGRIWRIGTLGYNARMESVRRLLAALEVVLPAHGFAVPRGEAIAAAETAYASAPPAAPPPDPHGRLAPTAEATNR
ncbi:MAG TPA: alanine--glyoxylate aminotransferase family protein [Chloroflexota bacterium]|nr:alanine--glyoxylate aminotransferase family protein [Chloroflexota bacterium]